MTSGEQRGRHDTAFGAELLIQEFFGSPDDAGLEGCRDCLSIRVVRKRDPSADVVNLSVIDAEWLLVELTSWVQAVRKSQKQSEETTNAKE